MRLSVGTNFDNRLPELLKGTAVDVFYGKLSSDLVGGGRPTFALPAVDRAQVEEHVRLVHEHGFRFNYLLNATCLDNLETTRTFQYHLRELLEWVATLKPDYVTVAIPALIDVVREELPNARISLSTFCNVNSIRQAQYFEERGVSEITLPESRNRDFAFLEQLRKHTDLSYQLIATNDCLLDCSLRMNHANFQSHASQSEHVTQGFALDACMLRCTEHKLRHPEELLKAPWIRPEDTAFYESLGYTRFKLTERMKRTEKIAEVAQAYSDRRYDGNLLRLLNSRLSEEDFEMPDFAKNLNGEMADPGKMGQVFRLLFSFKGTLDNRLLDGFLEGFKTRSCASLDCRECGYCRDWAEQTLKTEHDAEAVAKQFDQLFAELASGAFFRQEDEPQAPVWSEEGEALLAAVAGRKPDFIRSMARGEIRKKAEELAAERRSRQVEPGDVARANLLCTPPDFRVFAVNDLKFLGVDPALWESKEGVS